MRKSLSNLRLFSLLLGPLLAAAACDGTNPEPDGGADDGLHGDAGAPEADGGAEPDAGPPDVVAPGIKVMRPLFGGGYAEVPEGEDHLYGTPVHPVIVGLTPGETVTLESESFGYRAYANFVADDAGVVDPSRTAAFGGTYSGIDPDGLVWSMQLVGAPPSTSHYNIEYTVTRDGEDALHRTHVRLPMGSIDTTFEQRTGDGFVAEVYRSTSATTRQPVVIVLGGSGGGVPSFTASWIHSAFGWASVGLGYFGVSGLSPELEHIEVEAVGRAIEMLKAEPWIDAERIVLWGGSRGSELALLAGGLFPDVAGVMVEAPSGLVWSSVGDSSTAAWTIGGEDVPFVPSDPNAEPDIVDGPNGASAYAMTPVFLADMAFASDIELEAATIPVENIAGPVLLIGGADDLLWPSCDLADVAMARLESSGHAATHPDRSVCLRDAGHGIGPPGWSTLDGGFTVIGGYNYALGGTPGGTGRAQRQAYLEVGAFLEAVGGGE